VPKKLATLVTLGFCYVCWVSDNTAFVRHLHLIMQMMGNLCAFVTSASHFTASNREIYTRTLA